MGSTKRKRDVPNNSHTMSDSAPGVDSKKRRKLDVQQRSRKLDQLLLNVRDLRAHIIETLTSPCTHLISAKDPSKCSYKRSQCSCWKQFSDKVLGSEGVDDYLAPVEKLLKDFGESKLVYQQRMACQMVQKFHNVKGTTTKYFALPCFGDGESAKSGKFANTAVGEAAVTAAAGGREVVTVTVKKQPKSDELGLTFTKKNGKLLIVDVEVGGLMDGKKLSPGMEIFSMNGKETAGKTPNTAVGMVHSADTLTIIAFKGHVDGVGEGQKSNDLAEATVAATASGTTAGAEVAICKPTFYALFGYSKALVDSAQEACDRGEFKDLKEKPVKVTKRKAKKQKRRRDQHFPPSVNRVMAKTHFPQKVSSDFLDLAFEKEGAKFTKRTYENDTDMSATMAKMLKKHGMIHDYYKAQLVDDKMFDKLYPGRKERIIYDIAHGENGKDLDKECIFYDFDKDAGLIRSIRNHALSKLKEECQLVHSVISSTRVKDRMTQEVANNYLERLEKIWERRKEADASREEKDEQVAQELAPIVEELEREHPYVFDGVFSAAPLHVGESSQRNLSIYWRHRDTIDGLVHFHQMRHSSFNFIAVPGDSSFASFDKQYAGYQQLQLHKDVLGKTDRGKTYRENLEVLEKDFLAEATKEGLTSVRIYYMTPGNGVTFDGMEYLHMSVVPNWDPTNDEPDAGVALNKWPPKKEDALGRALLVFHDMIERKA